LSWLPADVALVWQEIIRGPSSRAQDDLSLWVLNNFDLLETFDFDFSQSEKRVLLMDSASLVTVSRCLGLLSVCGFLRTRIAREDQMQMKTALGEVDFEFFRQRILSWPRALSYSNPVKLDAQLGVNLLPIGQRLLENLFDGTASGSVRRMQLKLPRPETRAAEPMTLSAEEKKNLIEFCMGCVLKDRLTKWHWLF
jgi:YOP proteins translocation protein K (YscK)